MYLPAIQAYQFAAAAATAALRDSDSAQGLEVGLYGQSGWGFVLVLRTIILSLVSLVGEVWSALVSAVRELFSHPGAFMLHTLIVFYDFLHDHPHLVYTTCLSLFFGPVILLIPFLLLHEIAILVLFNLGFVMHGLVPGMPSNQDRYDALKEHFMDSREQVFASVDASTAIFNKWTSDNFLLMLTRVAGGLVGMYALYGVFEEWSRV